MKKLESQKCFEGRVEVWEHESSVLNCTMRFSIFLPPQAKDRKVPLVTFLSGLTCNHENFTTKAGAYKKAAELGLAIVAPDTSPRGDDVPDDKESYDFGKGAGFYINATQQPWSKNYHMESYITAELNSLICENFTIDKFQQGIMGHSMGGHGALTLFFKYPHLFKSVSAFAPIVAPSQVPWGQKAFSRYLGDEKSNWLSHDACALVEKAENASQNSEILIDQGMNDPFLEEQLQPDLFEVACRKSSQSLMLRLHEGYDHSYFFIQTFVNDHLQHHHKTLTTNIS